MGTVVPDDAEGPGGGSTRTLVVLSLLAALGGVAIGFVGGAFRWCLERADDLRAGLVAVSHSLGSAGIVVPVVATALCAALAALVVRAVPLAAGSGIQHVEAVSRGEADAPPLRVLPAKFIGGVLAIGSGLVLGREGPTVHMGAVIGGETARRAGRTDAEVRLLQTSLAGAGLAVAFNAPIGGALFVFEEVTKSFRPRHVLPTLIGVAVAVGCSRLIVGGEPDFAVPAVATPAFALLPVFIVFGVVTGLLGVLYNRAVIGALDLVGAFAKVPREAKAAVIGGVIGLALFLDPLAAGDGDALSQLVLDGGGAGFALPAIVLLLLVRFALGPLSYAAGTPGGLFAPLLALGALWGLLFASVTAWVLPGEPLGVELALVGMTAFFGATVRAPFTGIVIVIEMTAITSVTLPMLAATGCAVLVATLLRSAPVYDTLRERMLAAAAAPPPC
jgi:CIC family chloride channel protein